MPSGIESRLTGEQRLVLNAEPSPQAARFKAAGVSDVRLWDLPYTTLQRRLALPSSAVSERLMAYEPFMSTRGAPLYKARIMHLKGRFLDEKEAIAYYQKARPRNQAVVEEATRFAKECFEFLSRQKKTQGELTPAEERYLKQVAGRLAQQQVEAIIQGKLDASYWLGLIQYELGQYDYEAWKIAESQGKSAFAQKKFDEAMDYFTAALDYFRVRTLQFGAAIRPEGLLGCRAHYNIARTLEEEGQRQKAIDQYESTIPLRNDSGNLVLWNDPANLLRPAG